MSEEELTQVRTYLYQTFGIASDYSNGKVRIIYSYKWDTSNGTIVRIVVNQLSIQ